MKHDLKNNSVIIGICGKPGAGKDTLGSCLIHEFGFEQFAIKKPIEDTVKAIFGVDDFHLYDREAREQSLENWPGWTVRKMLQAIGQSMRDVVGGNVWAKSLCERLNYKPNGLKIVITDIRTPEDTEYIRNYVQSKGGRFILILVKRPGFGSTTTGGFAEHKLESYDLEPCCDIVLNNDGTIEELFSKGKKYLVGLDICDLDCEKDKAIIKEMMSIFPGGKQ